MSNIMIKKIYIHTVLNSNYLKVSLTRSINTNTSKRFNLASIHLHMEYTVITTTIPIAAWYIRARSHNIFWCFFIFSPLFQFLISYIAMLGWLLIVLCVVVFVCVYMCINITRNSNSNSHIDTILPNKRKKNTTKRSTATNSCCCWLMRQLLLLVETFRRSFYIAGIIVFLSPSPAHQTFPRNSVALKFSYVHVIKYKLHCTHTHVLTHLSAFSLNLTRVYDGILNRNAKNMSLYNYTIH